LRRENMPSARCHVPERALGVKGLLASFLRTRFAEAGEGSEALFLLVRNRGSAWVVTVFVFEVVEPFFSLRLHPNTSLREFACRSAVVRAPKGARH